MRDKVFTFTAKPKIRVYKQPPVRNFLAQKLDGEWIHIIRLFTPEEIKAAFLLVDHGRPELDYFDR